MRLVSFLSSSVLFLLSPEERRRNNNQAPFPVKQCLHASLTSFSSVSSDLSSTKQRSSNSSAAAAAPSKYDDLFQWLLSPEIGATINSKLKVAPSSRGGGYGVFVSRDVRANELLFEIPRRACVTLEDALQDPICGKTFQALINKAGPGGKTVVMAGHLSKERLKFLHDPSSSSSSVSSSLLLDSDKTAAKSSSSLSCLYGPYLATLPWSRGENDQEHILYWTEAEIETLLKGSMCYNEAKTLREEAALAYKVLKGTLGKAIREYHGEITSADGNQGGFLKWPWQVQSFEREQQQGEVEGLSDAMTGAFVCMLTRAFGDGEQNDDNGSGNEKLVPLLDMLQHSDDPNVCHETRKEDGTVEVRARYDIPAGGEILNQYRNEREESMPYHRFFTRFGFVPGITMEPIQSLLQDKSSIFFVQKREV